MRSSITQARRRLTDGENPSPSCAAQDDTALCLNIFANDLPNHPKDVLEETDCRPGINSAPCRRVNVSELNCKQFSAD